MLRVIVMVAAIIPSFGKQEAESVPSSVGYTQTIDVPLDVARSILSFHNVQAFLPYLGMSPAAIDVEYSDGNNLGSVRKFTVNDGNGAVVVEKKIGEGENHFTYDFNEVGKTNFFPFSLESYRATVHMIAVGDGQTLVSFTSTFFTNDEEAAKTAVSGLYAGFVTAAEKIAKAPKHVTAAYAKTIDVPLDVVKSITEFHKAGPLLRYLNMDADTEVTDGNNLGSVRKFTLKDSGAVIVEKKIGEGDNHFNYALVEDPKIFPFTLESYRATVHMIAVGDGQTLVAYTGTFLTNDPKASKTTIEGVYAAIVGGVEDIAANIAKQQKEL